MMENKTRKLILSSTSSSPVRSSLKKMGTDDFSWLYLGENVLRCISIENILKEKGKHMDISEILREKAKYLRQPYIDYIGKLSTERNSLEWWASPLSEKNPYVSKAFINSCFVKVALDIISKYPKENIVVFVEQECVRKTIAKNHKNLIIIDSALENLINVLSDIKIFVLYNSWFLFKNLYSVFISRIYGMHKQKAKEPLTLIYSPVNSRSFDKKGNYYESFFGELQEKLKDSGKNTTILPFIWVSLLKYPKIMKNMRKSNRIFIFPHSLMSITDIFRLFFRNLSNRPVLAVFPSFEGMDISSIINHDIRHSWLRARVVSNLLFYDMIKSIKKSIIDIDTFIYIYENLAREKIMCSAFRKLYPSSYLIGYQHSAFPIMRNDYFFSKHEFNILPSPDRIITNGKYFYDLFIKNGYPKNKVVIGTAIRYKYLHDHEQKTGPLNSDEPTVLITPSIDKFEANTLVWIALKAFENIKNINVIIKCHPFHPFNKISNDLKIKLPSHFSVSEDRLDILLPKTDVLLYTSSTTSVEALIMGDPTENIRARHSIDLNPLSYDPRLRCSAGTPDDLIRCVKDITSIDIETLSNKRKIWKNSVIRLLDRVDEKTYDLFLRPEI